MGKVSIKEAFAKVIKREVFLFNAHITHINTINTHFKPDERRTRKLLLHKKEIDRIYGKIQKERLTIVPLEIYFNQRNKAKIKLALAKGKKLHDKREDIKRKDMDREASRAIKKFI